MAHPTQGADIAPDLKLSSANALQQERNHLQALRRRFEAAAEALIRVHDHRKHNAALDEAELGGRS